jgi:hypothetical protein
VCAVVIMPPGIAPLAQPQQNLRLIDLELPAGEVFIYQNLDLPQSHEVLDSLLFVDVPAAPSSTDCMPHCACGSRRLEGRTVPVAQLTGAWTSTRQPALVVGARVALPSSTDTQEDDMNEQPTTPSDDDVEGHAVRSGRNSGDVEGHVWRFGRDTVGAYAPTSPKTDDTDDTDDVSGHLSGALGSKKKTEHNSEEDEAEGHGRRL